MEDLAIQSNDLENLQLENEHHASRQKNSKSFSSLAFDAAENGCLFVQGLNATSVERMEPSSSSPPHRIEPEHFHSTNLDLSPLFPDGVGSTEGVVGFFIHEFHPRRMEKISGKLCTAEAYIFLKVSFLLILKLIHFFNFFNIK